MAHIVSGRHGKRSTQRNRCSTSRSGAALVEMAISLSLFVTLILGVVDLGYGVFRHHVLTQATRQLARQAIIHGALADRTGVWGPDAVQTTAAGPDAIAQAIAPQLVGWNNDDVSVTVEWPDGGNDPLEGHRVRVRLSAPYQPLMTFIFGQVSTTLSAESTMYIAH